MWIYYASISSYPFETHSHAIASFLNSQESLLDTMEIVNKCSSTGKDITNDSGSVSFQCPSCGKATIIRSLEARKLATKYTCPNCGFTGPN